MGLTRHLRSDGNVSATLSYYGPGYRMTEHAHKKTQLSFILSGHLTERSIEGGYVLCAGSLLMKPAGFGHADTVGPSGCLILCLNYGETDPELRYVLDVRGTSSGAGQRYWRAAREFAMGAKSRGGALDRLSLLAGIAAPSVEDHGQPAMSQPVVGETSCESAARAGVHPVHYARMFRKKNGQSPRAFRKSEQSAAAMQDILFRDARLADVACMHGFSDQAHMSRTIKAMTGFTPLGLRRAFAAA